MQRDPNRKTMRKRLGFSLLELLAVLAVLAILTALGVGAFNRYRANQDLVNSANRLASELTNAKTQARSLGQTQMRGGVELAATPQTAVNLDRQDLLEFHIVEGSNLGLREVKRMRLLESSTRPLRIRATNLPLVPLQNIGDTGLILEVGRNNPQNGMFEPFVTVAFNPDGSVILPVDTEPGRITLDNGVYQRKIEISRLGNIKEDRI